MIRFKSLKYALPVAVLLATTALSMTVAKADWQPAFQNEDGSATLWYDDSTGKMAVTIEKDGKFAVYFDQAVINAMLDKDKGSDPDPNDPNNGKGTDKPDVEAMIKNAKGGSWSVKVNPEDSPLGGVITNNGGGKAPHWNPGDDDNKSPGSPPNSKPNGGMSAQQKAAMQKALNDAARQAALGGQGMYDGSEGGNENAPGINMNGGSQNAGKGSGGQGDDSKGGVNADDYKDNYVPKGESLGPKPELVNPTPDLKGHTATTKKRVSTVKLKDASSGKGSGKGDNTQTSNVTSPGLLEGGNGFSFNGPAGAGSVGGGAHGGATRATH